MNCSTIDIDQMLRRRGGKLLYEGPEGRVQERPKPIHNLFTEKPNLALAFLYQLRYDMLALRKKEC